MTDKFTERLTEYLDSECDDYGLRYSWEWNEDAADCVVTIENDYSDLSKELIFRHSENDNDLLIELTDDCFYTTREFDQTVKYFWMLIAPAIFPNN